MRRLLFMAMVAVLLTAGCAEELGSPGAEVEGFERVVLAELFTATWCGNCPKAEAGLDQLFDEEGPSKLAVIHWHPTQPIPDPFGLEEVDQRWDAYTARLDTLGAAALPTCIFNGVSMLIGAETNPYDDYKDNYLREREQGSPLELAISPTIAGDDLTVTVDIGIQDELVNEHLDLWITVVEHEVHRPDIPGHEELFSYVARAVETQAVHIEGQATSAQSPFTLDPSWNREQLYVVAFLQEELGGEVRQAVMTSLSLRDFSLTADDTLFTGESAPRSFDAPFTIENTGTLRDSIEIDLPAELLDLPAEWTAVLQGTVACDGPVTVALVPGEVVDSLSVRVTTSGSTGTGSFGVTATSLIEAGLQQTQMFAFQYGEVSFEASGPSAPVTVDPGQLAVGQLTLTNTGIEELQIILELPSEQDDLPAGWTATLTDLSTSSPIASPDTVVVEAGGSDTSIGVSVQTDDPGSGSVTVLASSPQVVGDPVEIVIEVVAGEVAFTIAPRDTTVEVELYALTAIHVDIDVTGSIESPIFVDANSTGMPAGWAPVICDESICYGPTYTIPVDKIEDGIIFEFTATSEASGTAEVYFSSTVDPTVTDTLRVDYAMAGGGEVAFSVAPQDTTVEATLYEINAVPIRIDVTGSVESPIFVDASNTGMPAEWSPVICDEGLCYGPTYTIPADKVEDGVIFEFTPTSEGSGTAEVYFSSTVDPSVVDTVRVQYLVAAGGSDFDRVVAVEFFTSIICANCPKAEGALDSLFAEEGANRMAMIHWHPLGGSMGRPEFGIAETDARMEAYFGIVQSNLPQVIIDGSEPIIGAVSIEDAYDLYRARYDQHIAESSPASIRISDQTGASEVTLNIEIEAASDSTLQGLDLTVVLMEYEKHGLSSQPIPTVVSGAARAAETLAVTEVPAGTTFAVDPVIFDLGQGWVTERLYAVAILQDPTTMEVVQSAMVRLNQGLAAGR